MSKGLSDKQCKNKKHFWHAHFFESGHLAYWHCERCQLTDRPLPQVYERLAHVNGWIEDPVRITAIGEPPPVSTRRWTTPVGTTLVEGEVSSVDHVGLAIPGLPSAHSYTEHDNAGKVIQTYEPDKKRLAPYGDHYWLTRYEVVGDQLIRLHSHCFEESTYDSPSTSEPRQEVMLNNFSPLFETDE